MSYVGNPALNEETKARIRTTFGQTMQLASAGRVQEAALGCDFILKMDPQFSPARKLLDRLDGATGPVEVSDLEEPKPAPAPDPSPTPDLPPIPPVAQSAAADPGPSPLGEDSAGAGGGELDLLDGLSLGSPTGSDPATTPTPAESIPPVAPPAETFMGSEASPARPSSESPSIGSQEASGPSLSNPSVSFAGSLSADALGGEQEELGPESSTESGDDDRVQALLDEGQAAFDGGSYQGAIDAWSRIFLIDIDHEEASRRIEDARRRKDETERDLEERFHSALDRIEAGELLEGRVLLEEVLEIQPDHVGAKERLEALDAAEERPEPATAPVADGAVQTLGPGELDGQSFGAALRAQDSTAGAASAPLATGAPAAAPAPMQSPYATSVATAAPKGRRGSSGAGGRFLEKRFLYIGAGALLVVLGLGGFLFSNWGTLFPNAPSSDPQPFQFKAPDPMADANRLYIAGDIEGALAVLDNVKEGNPRYERAQEQATEWRQEAEAQEQARLAAAQGAVEDSTRRDAMLESARRLYAEGEFFKAAKDFNAAARIQPLTGPAADMFEDAKRQLVPLQQQITLFREGEWERVQPTLWRILQSDPDNLDARRLLVDSYYNLAVQELRRGNAADAIAPLQEADRLRPLDPMIGRLLLLANSYAGRESSDSLFMIFVEELSYRR